jgi:hypothetical protein
MGRHLEHKVLLEEVYETGLAARDPFRLLVSTALQVRTDTLARRRAVRAPTPLQRFGIWAVELDTLVASRCEASPPFMPD